ncbi:MAG TPA: reverse transcriptase domain-containing protein, partial [Bacteroidia bacterium]|nr:reverse transcriptase domain-containing protein [Bacteroidia bacterium]
SFAVTELELTQTKITAVDINTGDSLPIKSKPRPIAPQFKEKVTQMIEQFLRQGVIEPSNSPWCSPITLVGKKDGTIRFCIDFRRLNSVTIKDAFPIPNIDSILASFANKKYFTSLDLYSGYWQIPLTDDAKQKTAFAVPAGFFQFKVLPFGLTNAVSIFQRIMSFILAGLDFVTVYVDDIIIASDSFDEHEKHLKIVLDRIRNAGLRIKPEKSLFFQESLLFLGHLITGQGIKMDEDKIKAIEAIPLSSTKKQLQSFLGMCSYYRKFIYNFSKFAHPLHKLVASTKDNKLQHTSETIDAFETLKSQFKSNILLPYPDFEAAKNGEKRPFVIFSDASGHGVGAVLAQADKNGDLRPLYSVSRKLGMAGMSYGSTKQELLAIDFACTKFQQFIMGLKTIIVTDNSAILPLFKSNKACDNWDIERLLIKLRARYDLQITHIEGKKNLVADCLSRSVENLELPVIKDKGVRVSHIIHKNKSYFGSKGLNRNKVFRHKIFNKFSHVPRKNNSNFQDILNAANEPNSNFTTSTLQYQASSNESTLPTPQNNLNWITAYLSCPNFCDLYKFLKDRIIPTTNPKFLISSAHNFFVVNSLLYFSDMNGRKLLCVPESLRSNIIDQAHGGTIGNHFGVKKIFLQLNCQFFWPNMRSDIESHVIKCQDCLFNRYPRNNLPPLNPIVTCKPLELVCIDLVDMTHKSSSGFRYILSIIDHFSRFVVTTPCLTSLQKARLKQLWRSIF